MSEKRETTLKEYLLSQDSQIHRLRERAPPPMYPHAMTNNSPLTNLMYTPCGQDGSKNGARAGPSLPFLDYPVEEGSASEMLARSSHTHSPSSFLIATAASSLLSLTPNNSNGDGAVRKSRFINPLAVALPNLDSPNTALTPLGPNRALRTLKHSPTLQSTTLAQPSRQSFESPAHFNFNELSPLPNVQVWDEF